MGSPAAPASSVIGRTRQCKDISLHLCPSKTPIAAMLHVPCELDQECPILQDPISTASFDILPRPFDTEHPSFTAITLCQCSHTFHAMALIYHWARSGGVQCPVCRSGPKNQRLSLRRLPKEWRYSLAARIRRQRRIDRAEAVEDDRRAAMHMLNATPAINLLHVAQLFLSIQIEVMSTVSIRDPDTRLPLTWTVPTTSFRIDDTIVFEVPNDELSRVPYGLGMSMRLVPRTNTLMQPLRPSRWFVAGVDQAVDANFSVCCDETGFSRMHYTMSTAAYDEMALHIFMAYEILIAVDD